MDVKQKGENIRFLYKLVYCSPKLRGTGRFNRQMKARGKLKMKEGAKKREKEYVFVWVIMRVFVCGLLGLPTERKQHVEKIDARKQNDELVILNTTRHGGLNLYRHTHTYASTHRTHTAPL